MKGVRGWLAFYWIGSLPLMMFYSVGLSGFFFDYPFGLALVIFLFLAIPLLLIPLRLPIAPRWNIAELWLVVVLMVSRALGVFMTPLSAEELPVVTAALVGIVAFSLVWAIGWTQYFTQSARVRNTFLSREC